MGLLQIWVFHPTPGMQHPPPVLEEGEIVTAASGLIVGPVDRETRTVAEQKGANGAVADEEHVAWAIPPQDVLDLADDAQLGIDGALPSPDADKGFCEKPVRHRLKLVGRQETCRRSIIFVHRLPHFDGALPRRSGWPKPRIKRAALEDVGSAEPTSRNKRYLRAISNEVRACGCALSRLMCGISKAIPNVPI